MHDADREHKIERCRFKWQVFQVCLNEMHIRKMAAQMFGLIDSSCMIGTEHCGTGFPADLCISATPATSVQDSFSLKITEQETCLRFKRCAVLCLVSDIEPGPLMPKTFQMFVGDKSRNFINDFP